MEKHRLRGRKFVAVEEAGDADALDVEDAAVALEEDAGTAAGVGTGDVERAETV